MTTLAASKFPERADVYICDACARDITAHLHCGQAHVRQPLGPRMFTCECGQRYRSGASEWDQLSEWEKQQWMKDVGLAIAFLVALGLFLVAAYVAIERRSLLLGSVLALIALFSIPLWSLFIAILSVPFEIAESMWRTRMTKS